MLSIIQMEYITKIQTLRSFTKVAEFYNVTQPTVSMQLQKAEKDIGFKIFIRGRRELKPTKKGLELIHFINDVLRENQELHDFIKASEINQTITLNIGVIPTMSLFAVPFLLTLKELNGQKVMLHIHEIPTDIILERISTGEIDAGIMAGNSKYEQIKQDVFGYEPLIVYGNNEQINQESSIKVEDLKGMQPWLLSEDNCLTLQAIKLCQLTEDHLKPYHGGNLQLIIDLVNQEGGFSILPGFAITRLDINEDYEKILQDSNPHRSLVLAKRKRPVSC